MKARPLTDPRTTDPTRATTHGGVAWPPVAYGRPAAVTLAVCALGLVALDSSGQPLSAKLFRGMWNALNLVTTLGDLTGLDEREKVFMMATMIAFLVIGGYAVSSRTVSFPAMP